MGCLLENHNIQTRKKNQGVIRRMKGKSSWSRRKKRKKKQKKAKK
jgi:hypothetical protein